MSTDGTIAANPAQADDPLAGPGQAGADLGLRQERRRRVRPGPAGAGRRDRLDRRHRGGAERGRHRRPDGRGAHRRARDPRRPREDAPPAPARLAARGPRRPRARGDPGARGDRVDRPRLHEPLPVRAGGRPARRHRRRGDREHRHRRADDDPRRRQEPPLRRGGGQAGELRRRAGGARGGRRRDLGGHTPLAGQRGVRRHRALRRRDQPLVRRAVRGLPHPPGRLDGEVHGPLLRREPAPAGGALHRGRRAGPRAQPRLQAPRQGPVVQQRARPRLGAQPARRPRRPGLRDRQAQQPVRGGGGRERSRRLREGALLRSGIGVRRRDRAEPADRRRRWRSGCTRTSSRC